MKDKKYGRQVDEAAPRRRINLMLSEETYKTFKEFGNGNASGGAYLAAKNAIGVKRYKIND